jgi:hypothetical protein
MISSGNEKFTNTASFFVSIYSVMPLGTRQVVDLDQSTHPSPPWSGGKGRGPLNYKKTKY